MKEILDGMRPAFKKLSPGRKQLIFVRPPANKRDFLEENKQYNVVPEYEKKPIIRDKKYLDVTEPETKLCLWCGAEIATGIYCDEICESFNNEI